MKQAIGHAFPSLLRRVQRRSLYQRLCSLGSFHVTALLCGSFAAVAAVCLLDQITAKERTAIIGFGGTTYWLRSARLWNVTQLPARLMGVTLFLTYSYKCR